MLIVNKFNCYLFEKGGIKAVVYTDALQMIILIVGLITISALGAQSVGGGQNVWNIAIETNRINMNGQVNKSCSQVI